MTTEQRKLTTSCFHSITVHAKCPVNQGVDYYDIEVECEGVIYTEQIEAAADLVCGLEMTQEELTKRFVNALQQKQPLTYFSATSRGRHGRVQTTCEVYSS